MDEVPPVVFEPVDGEGEFAVMIDRGDCVVLRDAMRAALNRAKKRNPSRGFAKRRRDREVTVFERYFERFENVRKAESAAFVARMQARESSQS